MFLVTRKTRSSAKNFSQKKCDFYNKETKVLILQNFCLFFNKNSLFWIFQNLQFYNKSLSSNVTNTDLWIYNKNTEFCKRSKKNLIFTTKKQKSWFCKILFLFLTKIYCFEFCNKSLSFLDSQLQNVYDKKLHFYKKNPKNNMSNSTSCDFMRIFI